jgi:hypothetical protein
MPNVASDQLGLIAVVALVGAAIGLLIYAPISRPLKAILAAGLILRVVGGLARFGVMHKWYDGVGDAVRYYRVGNEYAERFRALDFSPLWNTALWESKTWWGTQFVFFPSGFVLTVIGPTMLGEFIVFSLLAFAGLVALVVAFQRAFPNERSSRYAGWLLLFPSLWYWPSTVGKEALVVLGVGITALGFVGRRGRTGVFALLAGLALLFAVRPQLAALFIVCAAVAQWLTGRHAWSFGRVLQAVVILGIGLTTVWYAGREVGISSFDAEGLHEYVLEDPARRVGGGSRIDAVSVGWSTAPLAALNVLARPFPWESRNLMMLLSSAEITALWVLIFWRRRQLAAAIHNWRNNRLIAFALSFTLLYAVALGMMMSNLAIIARQRIFLFPFVFLLMHAVSADSRAPASAPARTLRPRTGIAARRVRVPT